jgi:hypothetical protein
MVSSQSKTGPTARDSYSNIVPSILDVAIYTPSHDLYLKNIIGAALRLCRFPFKYRITLTYYDLYLPSYFLQFVRIWEHA